MEVSWPYMRSSMSMTSRGLTSSVSAMRSASRQLSAAWLSSLSWRRLKKSLRWFFVVASLTMRQLRMMYSWISERIQCCAKVIRRAPRSGS